MRISSDGLGHRFFGDRGVRNVVTNIGQAGLEFVKTPSWVFLGQLQYEVDDHLSYTGSARLVLAAVAVVPLLGDQFPVPAENRIWCHNGCQFQQGFATESLSFDGQESPLVVGQDYAPLPLLFEERLDLGVLELDDLLLPLVDPSGHRDKQQLPGLKDEAHDRLAGETGKPSPCCPNRHSSS